MSRGGDRVAGGAGGSRDGAGRIGPFRATGGLPVAPVVAPAPDDAPDADAPSALLEPLRKRFRDVLVHEVLARLDPTDCAMLAQVGRPRNCPPSFCPPAPAPSTPCSGPASSPARAHTRLQPLASAFAPVPQVRRSAGAMLPPPPPLALRKCVCLN
jgi:hypothetical protein